MKEFIKPPFVFNVVLYSETNTPKEPVNPYKLVTPLKELDSNNYPKVEGEDFEDDSLFQESVQNALSSNAKFHREPVLHIGLVCSDFNSESFTIDGNMYPRLHTLEHVQSIPIMDDVLKTSITPSELISRRSKGLSDYSYDDYFQGAIPNDFICSIIEDIFSHTHPEILKCLPSA